MRLKFKDPKFILMFAFVICTICTILLLPMLPNELPMQFGSDGGVNWTLPKYIGILIMPAFASFFAAYYIKNGQFNYPQLAKILLLLILDIGFLGFIAFCI